MSHEPEFVPVLDGSGYDRGEPKSAAIAVVAVVCVVVLLLVILGAQAFYEHIHEQEVYEKVLAPVGEDLSALRAREDQQLHSYKYIDKSKGHVQLPIDRAMELLAKEYAEGKVQYSTKPTQVKPPEAVNAVAVPVTNAVPKAN